MIFIMIFIFQIYHLMIILLWFKEPYFYFSSWLSFCQNKKIDILLTYEVKYGGVDLDKWLWMIIFFYSRGSNPNWNL